MLVSSISNRTATVKDGPIFFALGFNLRIAHASTLSKTEVALGEAHLFVSLFESLFLCARLARSMNADQLHSDIPTNVDAWVELEFLHGKRTFSIVCDSFFENTHISDIHFLLKE